MLEIIVFFMLIFFMAAFFYTPEGCGLLLFKSFQEAVVAEKKSSFKGINKATVPEDSMLRRHFLTQLESEIEAALFPRPTDSVLQRHYDSLVAVELKNRLQDYR